VVRSFRDRDYLITPEGFIFAVIGNVHPPDRVIAYLKYIPDEQGKWGRDRLRYRRALQHYNVPSVMDSMRFLRSNAPQYIFESSVHGITLPAVPRTAITQHLRPEETFHQLCKTRERDELEAKAVRLVEQISNRSGVSVEAFGVTGSLLARIHDPTFSDIDLVIYGYHNAIHVRSLLRAAMRSTLGAIQRLEGESREKWITERVKSTPLTREDAEDLLARKWNIGLFDGTEFSAHAVHTESEVTEQYGDECYVPFGVVDVTATLVDIRGSLFMPAVYDVRSVRVGEAFPGCVVDRIVSFEGLYADIAEDGEIVRCRGKLERVESASRVGHRIVVGSPEAQGSDFILPLK